jgi:hypothetical protein
MPITNPHPCYSNELVIDVKQGCLSLPRWHIALLKEVLEAFAR